MIKTWPIYSLKNSPSPLSHSFSNILLNNYLKCICSGHNIPLKVEGRLEDKADLTNFLIKLKSFTLKKNFWERSQFALKNVFYMEKSQY